MGAEACARGGGALRRARQRDVGAHEQPDGERRVPLPHARQHRRHGGPLRYQAGRKGEGEERSGPEGPWHGDYTGSIWPRRTPTIVETPGSCIVTPYTASAACMVRGLCVMTMNCV